MVDLRDIGIPLRLPSGLMAGDYERDEVLTGFLWVLLDDSSSSLMTFVEIFASSLFLIMGCFGFLRSFNDSLDLDPLIFSFFLDLLPFDIGDLKLESFFLL